MSGFLQVFSDQILCHSMQRHIARLFAFTGYLQIRHATTFMPGVPDGELAQFLAPEGMIEQGRQNGAVPHAFQRFLGRSHKQLAGLVVGNCRGFAFTALSLRPFYAFDRIMRNGVVVAKILKQRRERRQPTFCPWTKPTRCSRPSVLDSHVTSAAVLSFGCSSVSTFISRRSLQLRSAPIQPHLPERVQSPELNGISRAVSFAFVLLRIMQTGEEPVKVSLRLASLDL